MADPNPGTLLSVCAYDERSREVVLQPITLNELNDSENFIAVGGFEEVRIRPRFVGRFDVYVIPGGREYDDGNQAQVFFSANPL